MPGAEPLHEVPVVEVAVLGLVHHNVVEGILPVLGRVLEVVQDILRDVHQVVEIQGVMLHLAGNIAREAGGAAHLVAHLAAGEHIGLDIPVEGLLHGDRLEELLDGLLRALDSHLVHRLLGDGLRVFLIEDGEGLGEAQPIDLLPQELHAEPVQGAHEVVVVPALDHLGDTAPHLRGRLVGEGEAEDVRRVYAQHVDDVGVAVGEGLGLARPCARHHAYAALGGLYGLLLA